MSFKFNEEWLKNAVQIEDEVDCDIQAGLDFGRNSDTYISTVNNYINHERLMIVLKKSLGTIFQNDELELLASELQCHTREQVIQKLQTKKSVRVNNKNDRAV
jgi:hypothetical protein